MLNVYVVFVSVDGENPSVPFEEEPTSKGLQYVYDDGVEAVLDQVLDVTLQQGLSGHYDEGLGLVGRQLLEPCA